MGVIIQPTGHTLETHNGAIQIGSNLELIKGESSFTIKEIYVSPSGQVSFHIAPIQSEASMGALKMFIEELGLWTSRDMDDISLDYSYEKDGQAKFVIDLMCSRGLLTYADTASFRRRVDRCLRSRSFIVHVDGKKAATGESFLPAKSM